VVGVYKDTGKPSLNSTSCCLPACRRKAPWPFPVAICFATANEADLGEDGGPRSHVMIYEFAEGEKAYPQIVAAEKDGNPVGFAALSGLTAVPQKPGQLFAVSDSVLGMQPTIYTIDATRSRPSSPRP
jgi:hypothetical protein